MDERCPDCSCGVSEKLENLQVLRHIMMMKKKEFEEIKKQRCTAHDDKTRHNDNTRSKSTADHNKTRRK
ncbi:MAG: hypothetical protein PHU49_05330 [Syntrophorhabdaceae bacterium]|nr:hypothetical protein [Syntrophorhabdaceae bacterium]MDD5243419.1 hypothetical protein [Syntrophorhabdaceae bacterium]